MSDTEMQVQDIADELADLDALEESITNGVQPAGSNAKSTDAPAADKPSMGAKAAEYSVDEIPDLDDLDALERSIAGKSEPEPEPEQEPEQEPETSGGTTEAKPTTGCARHLPECCTRGWWTQEVHPAKREELAHVFAFFDADGNGSIDKNELRNVINDLAEGGHMKRPTEEMVDELMAQGDKDGDGSIDFPEFVELVTSAHFNLHPSLCERCQNPRRDRRCFLRQKRGAMCGPPDDDNFDPASLPHPAFWVLARTTTLHTAIGVVLLVLAMGADGDVMISSGLSAILIAVAAFGLTLTYAGVPASRGLFGLYMLMMIALICVNNVMLIPYIFEVECEIDGVDSHDACEALIHGATEVGDAKTACLAARSDAGQSYCNFKTNCDLNDSAESCAAVVSDFHQLGVCTWRDAGFCNTTSMDTAVSVIGGTCLTSVACRFRTALIWLSVIYTVIVGCSLLASIFVLFDSMKPHQLQFAHAEESPWEQALMMSMDAELHHKQKRGIVSSEYGTQARASKFVTGMYDSGPPAKEKQKTLGM